jgi:uncharacterized protein (DUF1800 family)
MRVNRARDPVSKRRLLRGFATVTGRARGGMRRPAKPSIADLAALPLPQGQAGPPPRVRWLQKATFGCTAESVAAFDALPGADDDAKWEAWVAGQLDPDSIPDDDCAARIDAGGFVTLDKSLAELWNDYFLVSDDYYLRMLPIAEIECTTTTRAIYSRRQLFEVMTDFWHDHFSVFGWDYEGGPLFVHYDRDVIRPNVFGNFRQMLQAVGESTTMMFYLDLYASSRAGPNENYARELMELHTLGSENYGGVVSDPDSPGNLALLGTFTAWDGVVERLEYVDDDVYEITRALTGWTVSASTWPYQPIGGAPAGTFVYDDGVHDPYPKHILTRYFGTVPGHEQDGLTVFDMLAQHPGTAHFVAGKLCRRLVGDRASAALVDAAAGMFQQQWQAPDQLAQVTGLILRSDEFKSTWGDKVRRPFDAAVAALRVLRADFTPTRVQVANEFSTTDEFNLRLQQAGQRLFFWPAPNGYPDNATAWSGTGALAMTWKLLARLTEIRQAVGYDTDRPYLADCVAQTQAAFPDPAARTAATIAHWWCDRLFGFRPEPACGKALDFLRQNAAADAPLDIDHDDWSDGDLASYYTQSRLRTMIALLLCSPDFLRR